MRNNFEIEVAKLLDGKYEYEATKLTYIPKPSKYTPDFVDLDKKWMIESKGFWRNNDRAKMLLIKQQYPDWRIIMLFQDPNKRINKISNTTYAQWCDKKGIEWATLETINDKLK